MSSKARPKACHPEPCQPLAKAFVHGPLWQGVRIPSLHTNGVPISPYQTCVCNNTGGIPPTAGTRSVVVLGLGFCIYSQTPGQRASE